MKLFKIILLISLVILNTSCTSPVAGNSSETNNGVVVVAGAGIVKGKAPPYTSMYLIKENYQPFEAVNFDSAFTDSTGEFRFTAVGGAYNLFLYGNTGLRLLLKIALNEKTLTYDTLYDTLSLPGSVEGLSSSPQFRSSYLFLEGSTFFTKVDSNGYFRLDSIPEGEYTLKQLASSDIKNISPETKDTLGYELTSIIKIRSDSIVTLKW
jgi:hypothetical protein